MNKHSILRTLGLIGLVAHTVFIAFAFLRPFPAFERKLQIEMPPWTAITTPEGRVTSSEKRLGPEWQKKPSFTMGEFRKKEFRKEGGIKVQVLDNGFAYYYRYADADSQGRKAVVLLAVDDLKKRCLKDDANLMPSLVGVTLDDRTGVTLRFEKNWAQAVLLFLGITITAWLWVFAFYRYLTRVRPALRKAAGLLESAEAGV